jgi:hypothetical protein
MHACASGKVMGSSVAVTLESLTSTQVSSAVFTMAHQ